MPVPEGAITTSDILSTSEVTQDTNVAEYEAALTDAIEKVKEKDTELLERLEDEDDLQELP